MNFTREPIIETIITPKEGFKLIIRNSHGNSQEEYSVNSVEIVSFGKSFFFRSLEKPKAFLLPVSDFEVLESREIRTVLKKAQIDKSIKIGGAKSFGKSKEAPPKKEEVAPPPEPSKKGRSRKAAARRRSPKGEEPLPVQESSPVEESVSEEIAAPVRRTLLPPPTSLIAEQISRYKDYLETKSPPLPEEEEQAEDLSFFPEEGVFPQEPSLMETESREENTVVDIEKASTPSEPEG